MIVFIIIAVFLLLLICDYLFVQQTPTVKEMPEGQHIGNWRMAVVLIAINLFFIIIITYGFFNIEFFYVGNYWAGNGTYAPAIYEAGTTGGYYSLAYVYIFTGLAFIHIILFFKCGYDAWQEALLTKGQMEYKSKWR